MCSVSTLRTRHPHGRVARAAPRSLSNGDSFWGTEDEDEDGRTAGLKETGWTSYSNKLKVLCFIIVLLFKELTEKYN